MKSEEVDTLKIKKKKEGKSPKQISKEISNLNESQRNLKGQTKEIVRLNNIIAEKDKQIKRLEKKVFDLQIKEDLK